MSAQKNLAKKALFLGQDEFAFAILQCVAQALGALSSLELLHASDLSEARYLLDILEPEVLVVEEEALNDYKEVLDSFSRESLPIVVQTSPGRFVPRELVTGNMVLIEKNESIEGIRQMIATASEAARTAERRARIDLH